MVRDAQWQPGRRRGHIAASADVNIIFLRLSPGQTAGIAMAVDDPMFAPRSARFHPRLFQPAASPLLRFRHVRYTSRALAFNAQQIVVHPLQIMVHRALPGD